jgi:hypothetical protein
MEVRMRKAFVVAAAFVLATTFSASAMPQQANPPKPEQKPEEKAQTSVAGKWDMTVDSDQGSMQTTLDVKQDGKKITGTLTGPQGAGPIEGEYADGKLTFSLSFDGPNGSMQIGFTATMKADGSLAGTLDFGQGQIPWHAVRAKG